MNDRTRSFLIAMDARVFAQCRDCLTPMLGIRDQNLRDFCYECTEGYKQGVDMRLCRGL